MNACRAQPPHFREDKWAALGPSWNSTSPSTITIPHQCQHPRLQVMPPPALQASNTTTVSSKVLALASSRARELLSDLPRAAPVHRAQDLEMPASTHRVRSMKELGSWEGASASQLRSPVSGTGALVHGSVVRLRVRGRGPPFSCFALALRIARILSPGWSQGCSTIRSLGGWESCPHGQGLIYLINLCPGCVVAIANVVFQAIAR